MVIFFSEFGFKGVGVIMKFVIVLKGSDFVVCCFSSDSKVRAEVVFGKFLKENVKDDCFGNLYLKCL